MADNYLERRMDDLKHGRLNTPSSASRVGGPRKGYIEFPFPLRRVLVTGGASGIGLDIARTFAKAGCKTAIFDSDSERGKAVAYKEGVRYYDVDVTDREGVEKAFANLAQAWRDVDVVICCIEPQAAIDIAECWHRHREGYPPIPGCSSRMIILNPTADIVSQARQLLPEVSVDAMSSEMPVVQLSLLLSLPAAQHLHVI